MATKKRVKGKELKFQPSGDVKRVIPLGDNEWAYLLDANGKTLHLRRDSDEFVQKCAENDREMGGKVSEALRTLGWDDVLERMASLPPQEDA